MMQAPDPIDGVQLRGCPAVTSTVNYLGSMECRPVFHARQRERDNLVLEPREVEIRDVRTLNEQTSLEINGFTLVDHPTGVDDFTDDSALPVYQREIEALVLELTGADRVIALNTVLRWSERAGDKTAFVNSHPARFVHVDYSRRSFDEFARVHLAQAGEDESLLQRRYVAYNIWRVTTLPPQDVPLAVCDARTTGSDDVTIGDAVIDATDQPERRFESSLYHANPAHRWFWYSDMQPDEVLVFKAFDSDLDRVQGCPHSGFDNPDCPADAPARASVEIRAFAFY